MDIQLRRDFGQSDRTMAAAEITERELRRALTATRIETGGLSIKEVADVIKEAFYEEEIKALLTNFNEYQNK